MCREQGGGGDGAQRTHQARSPGRGDREEHEFTPPQWGYRGSMSRGCGLSCSINSFTQWQPETPDRGTSVGPVRGEHGVAWAGLLEAARGGFWTRRDDRAAGD